MCKSMNSTVVNCVEVCLVQQYTVQKCVQYSSTLCRSVHSTVVHCAEVCIVQLVHCRSMYSKAVHCAEKPRPQRGENWGGGWGQIKNVNNEFKFSCSFAIIYFLLTFPFYLFFSPSFYSGISQYSKLIQEKEFKLILELAQVPLQILLILCMYCIYSQHQPATSGKFVERRYILHS